MRPRSLVLAVGLIACRPTTIDTVQPGAVAKTAFDGEWFWRRTVTDVPYGTSATFAGATDALERIVWKIEEDVLLGYRSYPHVDATGPETDGHYGAPLLVFPIEKHFDIRRDYDRRTGEEGNVVVENIEAPWADRAYLRVDWSQNLADVRFSVAGLDATVLGWSSTEGSSAPQFDDSDGDGTIDSMLVDQRMLIEPDTTTLAGFGDVPVCLFYGQAQVDCAASEVSVRHSFLRTDARDPIEGLAYDDRYMETFGYFLTDRLAYDEAYGLVHPNRNRFANRHPLFGDTFVRDAAGRVECRGGDRRAPCAQFSADEEPQPVVRPVADRPLKPIVYHAGPGFPADLIEPMQRVAAEWNRPLADAVNGARYWDCIERGGRRRACSENIEEDVQVFVFCPHNPSRDGDPDVCNTDHTGPDHVPDGIPDEVKIGDLRYSLAHVFTDPQLASPFGYGPSAADPLGTVVSLADGQRLGLGAGEIVSGTAFVYGHVLDNLAHRVADLVQLLNGELDPEAFVEGEDVTAWVAAQQTGGASALAPTATRSGGPAADWTPARVEDRLSRMDGSVAARMSGLHHLPRPTTPAEMRSFLEQADQVVQQSGAFGAGQAGAHQALERLLHSDHVDIMWNAETIGLLGYDPTTVGPEDLEDRGPLDLLDPGRVAEREAGRVLAGQHAVDFHDAAFADSSLVGLARRYADQGLSYDAIVADVRAELFVEVMLHEVGHTLGLRHNFAASFDALNFRPEYWSLRNDGSVAPRHVDPETEAERNGGIRTYQYSSVMDYHGSSITGWAGLGHYDEAAVKFGYAGLVEVFDQLPADSGIPGLPPDLAVHFWSAFNDSNLFPAPVLTRTDGTYQALHYTQLPQIIGDLEARVDVPISLLAPQLSDNPSFGEGLAVVDDAGGAPLSAPAVPYRFCSDEFAVGVTCSRFDQGADPYEAHQFLFERYANDYVLRNFARQRYGFGNPERYVSRLHDRTFEPIRTWERYYALFHGIFDVPGDPAAADFFADDYGFGGWTAATDDSFRFLVQTVTRPEPGSHGEIVRPDGLTLLAPGPGPVDIELIDGAYYESEWDFASGYHWFERQSRIGSYFDRMLALMTLTNTASYNFIGYDTAIDPRAYALGFQDLYRDPLALVLGELLADEADRYAPILQDGQLVYPDPLDPGLAWPPAGANVVQPAAYWLVQYDAGLFGKALLSFGYDRSFINRARVFVQGTGDAVEPGPDQATVTFDDPVSGKTWVAWSTPWTDAEGAPVLGPDGSLIELGSSARLLQKAQHLADRCETEPAACQELQRVSADLDLHLAVFRAFDAAP